MTIIKDSHYWKEYNLKRKAYLQQKNKERYHKGLGCINTTEKATTTILTTDTTKPVVLKTDTTENNTTLQPELIQPILQPCPNCCQLKENLETEKENFNSYLHNFEAEIINKHQLEIIHLKEKLREKSIENKQLIEKYSRLENNSQNQDISLSMPDLYALISKHQRFQTIQHLYSDKDKREREFLKELLAKLWDFN